MVGHTASSAPARRAVSHRNTAAAENKDNSMQLSLQEDTAKKPVLATIYGSFSVISSADVWAGPVYPHLSWKEWVSRADSSFQCLLHNAVKYL